MKKKFILLFCIFLSTFKIVAQPPTFQWALSAGGTYSIPNVGVAYGDDGGTCVKADASGNVFTTGYFWYNADFDNGPGTYSLSANGYSEDVFISKNDPNGNLIWAKKIGSKASDKGLSLMFDAVGNICYTGYFSDTTDFDPGVGTYTLTSIGSNDIFISKLDQNGSFIWAKSIGGVSIDKATSVYIDGSNNIYLTGIFNGTVDFDSGPSTFTLSSFGNNDVFILKLDASGNFVWAKQMGGTLDDQAFSIVVDQTSNVYLTGYFSGTADFDTSPLTFSISSVGQKDIFVAKIDPSGNLIWAKSVGSSTDDVSYSIGLDGTGNVYTTGYFGGVADFDPSASTYTLSYFGAWSDVFIYKLDNSGNFVWAKAMNSWNTNEGRSLFIDNSGNVYSTGIFCNTMDFDPGPGTYYMTPATGATGSPDIYVSKLNSAGNFLWARKFGGPIWDYCSSISVDPSQNIFVTGTYAGTSDFDPGMNVYNLSSTGGYDLFVNKLGPCTVTPATPISTTPSVNLSFCTSNSTTLTVSGTGTIYWYPTLTGTTALASGTAFITPTLTTGSYTYYAIASTCTVSASRAPITVTVNSCVGINELQNEIELVSIYPNPNNGEFEVVIKDGVEEYELILLNVLGQKIRQEKIYSGKNNFDLREQSKGVYFCSILSKDNTIYKTKIIIQ